MCCIVECSCHITLSLSLFHTHARTLCITLLPGHSYSLPCLPFQNDITDVLDLTFSMDADEEKLILYERTEVMNSSNFMR